MADNHMPYPSFAKIFYHSKYGPHVSVIPTKAYTPPDLVHTDGKYIAWDLTVVDANTMWTDFLTHVATQLPTTSFYDSIEFWSKSSPTAIPVLQHRLALGIAGTSSVVGWDEAVQKTYFFRDIDNGAGKIILLDVPTDNSFNKSYVVTSAENVFIADFTNQSLAFQTRAGGKPAFFKALTIELNHRLRRTDRLT